MITVLLLALATGGLLTTIMTLLAARDMAAAHRSPSPPGTSGGYRDDDVATGTDRTHTDRGKGMLEHILGALKGEQHAPTAAPQPAAAASPRVRTSPDMEGLPDSARPLIASINGLMEQIERRIEGDPMAMPLIIEMTQMRDVHLPRLCRSYVEIPEAHRREIYTRTGKSASFHLKESLAAMETRLHDIDRALAQRHISTFETNSDFVRRTYGDRSDPLG